MSGHLHNYLWYYDADGTDDEDDVDNTMIMMMIMTIIIRMFMTKIPKRYLPVQCTPPSHDITWLMYVHLNDNDNDDNHDDNDNNHDDDNDDECDDDDYDDKKQ